MIFLQYFTRFAKGNYNIILRVLKFLLYFRGTYHYCGKFLCVTFRTHFKEKSIKNIENFSNKLGKNSVLSSCYFL